MWWAQPVGHDAPASGRKPGEGSSAIMTENSNLDIVTAESTGAGQGSDQASIKQSAHRKNTQLHLELLASQLGTRVQ